MQFDRLSRCPLAQLPTPIEPLPRLTAELGGPTLFVKRDDQTGLALGGNKTRKLEYLVADAIDRGADTLITAGAPQSNHCRQTAAAAARLQLQCDLVLGGDRPPQPNGNVLLDQFCGARLHYTSARNRNQKMVELADQCRQRGQTPYVIPVGGSNGLGAVGYVAAMYELVDQIRTHDQHVDQLVVASSSGGTQAGLVLGAKLAGFHGKILGISIDQQPTQQPSFETMLSVIANQSAECIGTDIGTDPDDFHVQYGYLGGGYGVVGELERAAIWRAAGSDALILDPVYTGRAMGALMDLVQQNSFSRNERILFWHTGGAPALFAYASELTD